MFLHVVLIWAEYHFSIMTIISKRFFFIISKALKLLLLLLLLPAIFQLQQDVHCEMPETQGPVMF